MRSHQERTLLLAHRACCRRESVIRIATDQSDRSNNKDQNDRKHDRIFSNVLAPVLRPNSVQKLKHTPPLLLPFFNDERHNLPCQTAIVTSTSICAR